MKYDEPLIPSDYEYYTYANKRTSNYVEYLQEISKPSDPERQLLLRDFLDGLYSLETNLIWWLEKERLSTEKLVEQDLVDDNKLKEFVARKEKQYPLYFRNLPGILRLLRVGYEDSATENKIRPIIKEELARTDAPDTLRSDLIVEFLKIWKVNRLGFLYLGDITLAFDGSVYLRMADFLFASRTPKEQAIMSLMNHAHFESHDYELPLKYYLIDLDMKLMAEHIMYSYPSDDKDEIELERYKIRFNRIDASHPSVKPSLTGIELYEDNKKILHFYYRGVVDQFNSILINGNPVAEKYHKFEELSALLSSLTTLYEKLKGDRGKVDQTESSDNKSMLSGTTLTILTR